MIAAILVAIVLMGLLRIEPYARPQARPEMPAAFRRAAAGIGPSDSVAASSNLGPHLCMRRDIWLFDQAFMDADTRGADWIVVKLEGSFFGFKFASRGDCRDALLGLLARGDYGATSMEHDVLVLRRGALTDRNAAVAEHLRGLSK